MPSGCRVARRLRLREKRLRKSIQTTEQSFNKLCICTFEICLYRKDPDNIIFYIALPGTCSPDDMLYGRISLTIDSTMVKIYFKPHCAIGITSDFFKQVKEFLSSVGFEQMYAFLTPRQSILLLLQNHVLESRIKFVLVVFVFVFINY